MYLYEWFEFFGKHPDGTILDFWGYLDNKYQTTASDNTGEAI